MPGNISRATSAGTGRSAPLRWREKSPTDVGGGLVYRHPRGPDVPNDGFRRGAHPVFDPKSGPFELLGHPVVYRGTGFTWQGKTYSRTDYKGRPIPVPDATFWQAYQGRLLAAVHIDRDGGNVSDIAAFGTTTDAYEALPYDYGFMPPSSVLSSASWQLKRERYDTRLDALDPAAADWRRRIAFTSWGSTFYGDRAVQDIWKRVTEMSGLRIKHAPGVLVLNRFLTDPVRFAATYLSGSQGSLYHGVPCAAPEHVTDREIYRLFASKHTAERLATTVFADADTDFVRDRPVSRCTAWCMAPHRRWSILQTQ